MSKNTDGSLGPICNNCGGYGFTNTISDKGGASANCSRCNGTGVDERKVLDARLAKIEQTLEMLCQLIATMTK